MHYTVAERRFAYISPKAADEISGISVSGRTTLEEYTGVESHTTTTVRTSDTVFRTRNL